MVKQHAVYSVKDAWWGRHAGFAARQGPTIRHGVRHRTGASGAPPRPFLMDLQTQLRWGDLQAQRGLLRFASAWTVCCLRLQRMHRPRTFFVQCMHSNNHQIRTVATFSVCLCRQECRTTPHMQLRCIITRKVLLLSIKQIQHQAHNTNKTSPYLRRRALTLTQVAFYKALDMQSSRN